MKKIFSIIFGGMLLLSSINAQTLHEKIINVNSEIDADSVRYFIQSLENFGSRFEYNDNRIEIANWLKSEFIRMGYQQVELDSFICNSSINGQDYEAMQYNVVATLPGTKRPNDIYVIGGHYDSFNTSPEDAELYAPGADDNASGTTAALETARAIMAAGYQPEATIQFVCFAAEELMLFGYSGSEYMAESRRQNGANIKLMINDDMIANNPRPIDESRVSINYYSGYEHLKDVAYNLVKDYTMVNPMEGAQNQWSDSHPFYTEGFPAIYFEEYDFSPYYHTADDRVENYDVDYCAEVIKASSAMLIYSIESTPVITNLIAEDVGNGSQIRLNWNSADVDDLLEYRIYYGGDKDSLVYYGSTVDTLFTIDGLTTEKKYFFGVSVVDRDNDESFTSVISFTPNILPLAPALVNVQPKWHSIELSWANNNELDFMTYKIIKVPQILGDYFPNLTYYTNDTTFVDTDVQSGIWYEYTVQAMDVDSNISVNNSVVTSRAITLDKGILFVNETTNGDGSIGDPSFTQLDNFYYSLPNSNFEIYDLNIEETENLSLANLGAHQSVIWHIDKSSDVSNHKYLDVIEEYLSYGGNLLFTGYKPSKVFSSYIDPSNEYYNGNFIFDYFDITKSENPFLSLFNSAQSESVGYPDLELDLEKINSNDGHIRYVEVFNHGDKAKTIYSYGTDYESSDVKGVSSGKTMGFEFLSDDYNAVILSLPLYYVKIEQASEFLNYVLNNKFNTPTGIKNNEDEEKLVTNFSLEQNYPNPFNPTTNISFSIPKAGHVELVVYDLLGREVANIINTKLRAGYHSFQFNGSKLSSGIYFYTLKANNFTSTKKMMLMK